MYHDELVSHNDNPRFCHGCGAVVHKIHIQKAPFGQMAILSLGHFAGAPLYADFTAKRPIGLQRG